MGWERADGGCPGPHPFGGLFGRSCFGVVGQVGFQADVRVVGRAQAGSFGVSANCLVAGS